MMLVTALLLSQLSFSAGPAFKNVKPINLPQACKWVQNEEPKYEIWFQLASADDYSAAAEVHPAYSDVCENHLDGVNRLYFKIDKNKPEFSRHEQPVIGAARIIYSSLAD